MTSVAEVKSSIAQALQSIEETVEPMAHIAEKLTEAQALLAVAVEGSEHEMATNVRAAFLQALEKLTECQEAVQIGVQEAQTYAAVI